jgi:hypothetical protein
MTLDILEINIIMGIFQSKDLLKIQNEKEDYRLLDLIPEENRKIVNIDSIWIPNDKFMKEYQQYDDVVSKIYSYKNKVRDLYVKLDQYTAAYEQVKPKYVTDIPQHVIDNEKLKIKMDIDSVRNELLSYEEEIKKITGFSDLARVMFEQYYIGAKKFITDNGLESIIDTKDILTNENIYSSMRKLYHGYFTTGNQLISDELLTKLIIYQKKFDLFSVCDNHYNNRKKQRDLEYEKTKKMLDNFTISRYLLIADKIDDKLLHDKNVQNNVVLEMGLKNIKQNLFTGESRHFIENKIKDLNDTDLKKYLLTDL